jgi:hypothetical protein
MIYIEQKPLKLTPVNTQHIYTVSSPLSGETDYRYIFDLYVDTTTANPTKITRLLVAPNTYGKGIIDVQDIVKNYVEGNVRSEQPQYTSETTTGTTSYGLITNTKGIAPSNAFNADTNYNIQTHVRDYRVMVGEQYTSGNTTVVDISTGATTPATTFEVEFRIDRLYWYNAGGNAPEGQSITTGVDIVSDSPAVAVTNPAVESSQPINTAPFTPNTSGQTITISEKYSGKYYTITYNGEFWDDLQGPFYPVTETADPKFSPDAVTIWPGTTLTQGSYTPYLTNNTYWTDTTPINQHEYWEVKRYLISGTTVNEQQPSNFLTTAGNELYSINDLSPGIITQRARRRYHHPKCPILVSWFNGLLSSNPDFEFNNDVSVLNYSTGVTHTDSYINVYENEFTQTGYTGLTPQNDRILYWNQIQPNIAGGKICFWLSDAIGEYQYDGFGYSEVLEYYLKEDSCLSDPIHVVFLNRQGVWDTYTLDRKALKTSNITRKTFDKGMVTDTNMLSLLSSNRRKTIYDQSITESMAVNTWYLDDNDRVILEDLFMSPEVYIILDHDWTGKTEKSYNPYLLPVVVNTNTLTEYKNRYNKTAQYGFTLEYTPINQYKTQG